MARTWQVHAPHMRSGPMPGRSYRDLRWESRSVLQEYKPGLLRSFLKRQEAGEPAGEEPDPQWQDIESILCRRGAKYLVKWRGLGYSDCTWEQAGQLASEADKARGFGMPGLGG